jgi:hypothetical protein
VASDVAHGGRTEQGVGDGMRQRIGVRVPEQAVGVGNGHPAQNQGAAGHQRVAVPAFANAKWRCE